MSTYRGRFAPSPTGDLHLGSAATALVAWLRARTAGGVFVLRMEDLDTPRVVPGVERCQLDDLAWLGLDWDEGPDVGGPHAPYRQSERSAHYAAALDRLAARGATFHCDCSRREIADVASAPHGSDEGPRYPGTCRAGGMDARPFKRPPAVRLRVAPGSTVIDDRLQGRLVVDVAGATGDFVLRRGDGVWAYHLAVVVDDLAMGVTEVVRGADLLPSAPRQAVLARLLGHAPPAFAHVPLVVRHDGARLAKRDPGMRLREYRDAGVAPEAVVGWLAFVLGLTDSAAPTTPPALAATFDPTRLMGVRERRLPPRLPLTSRR